MKNSNTLLRCQGGANYDVIKDRTGKTEIRYQNIALALTLTMSAVQVEVSVKITGQYPEEEFELQSRTDPVQSFSERCELTMFNPSIKTSRECARKRKMCVRARHVLIRHPYLVGITTATGSILLESAVNYWMPSIWQLLNNTIQWLFM
jgi:hypothetical protein